MAALSTTTLGAALSADAQTVYLASGTGVSFGTLLFVDKEAMSVTEVLTATGFKVARGFAATTAAAHASGATVYVGTPQQFYADDPIGVPESYPIVTPWINLVTGVIWNVSGSAWVPSSGPVAAGAVSATSVDSVTYSAGGTPGVDAGPFTAITAITVKDGLVTSLTGT